MERVDDEPISWKGFKVTFFDHFFPIELWEAKMMKFINLKQGSMSVSENLLKFKNLSKYAPYLIANPRQEFVSLY